MLELFKKSTPTLHSGFTRQCLARLGLAAIIFTLSACGGVSGVNNNGGGNVNPSPSPTPTIAPGPLAVNLQLDYIGTIPVLNGAATSSYFYVHNDGDSTINGIGYTLGNVASSVSTHTRTKKAKNALAAAGDVIDDHGFVLKADSLTACASIAAHSYCKIEFIAPSLSLGNQNNSLLKISVKDANGFSHTFDQVINYSYYNVGLNSGVNFATSADVVANITNKRYMMSYLVGGGSGQTYSNVNLQIANLGAIQINQGFVNGQSMASGELIPVEFNVNILSELPTPANVTPQYVINTNTTQTTKLNSKTNQRARVTASGQALKTALSTSSNGHSLQVTQIGSGQSLYVNTSSLTSSAMALKLGVVPIIPAPSTEANAPTIYVSNFGDNVSGFTIEPASNNVKVYANSCSGTIESNASCSFKLGVDSANSGSSDVLFKVNGQTIFTKVVYYAPPADPSSEEAVITNDTPVSQMVLDSNQSSSVINLVFSNLGNYPLTDLVFTPKNSSSGTTYLKIISNSCNPQIESQSQCVIQVQVIGGSAGETGGVYLEVGGKSGSTSFTTQSGVINYGISATSRLMITAPLGAESSLSVVGNNQESATTTFTVQNGGSSSIALKSIALEGIELPAALAISNNSCGNSLAAKASCNITVKYGPLQPESNDSGVANLVIRYGDLGDLLVGTINYSVTALDSHLEITNVTTTGFNGDGSSASPYHGSGCDSAPLTMTITYKNMSDNYVAQNMSLNIIDGHVSPYMSVESTATTCGYGANPKNLGIGQSCNLVLVANRSTMINNASFNLNVNYPSASWNTTQGFIIQNNFSYNGSSTAYADYSQPVMVSSVDPSSGASLTRTVTQVLANAEGCGDLQTTISAIPYVTQATVSSGNCTVNGDLSVSCTNSSGNNSNTIVYTIDNMIPTPATLFMTFSLQTAGKQVWYSPSILMFNIGN